MMYVSMCVCVCVSVCVCWVGCEWKEIEINARNAVVVGVGVGVGVGVQVSDRAWFRCYLLDGDVCWIYAHTRSQTQSRAYPIICFEMYTHKCAHVCDWTRHIPKTNTKHIKNKYYIHTTPRTNTIHIHTHTHTHTQT